MSEVSMDVQRVSLQLPDIHCAGCCFRVEDTIGRLPYVDSVAVNLTGKRLTAELNASDKADELKAQLEAMGYPGLEAGADQLGDAVASEQRSMLARIGVAGIGLMQVMMFALAGYLAGEGGMDPAFETLMRWASFVIAVPVMFYSAMPFHHAAIRNVSSGVPGMDVPVSIAITAAFTLSAFHTITATGEVYFDSLCMFTFLLLCGRYLEAKVRHHYKIDQSISEQLLPEKVVKADGRVIALRDVLPGDLLKIAPDETIPADGVVEQGMTTVDESAFTGEFMPQRKLERASVLAGSRNLDAAITIRVTSPFDDALLNRISRLQSEAAAFRPPFARLADYIARYFVSIVLLIAFATGAAWYLAGDESWFVVMLSVLVVSCPCALSLATPVAYAIAGGTLGRQGLLVSDGSFLEKLMAVTTVIFDKTGTLTAGRPQLMEVHLADTRESKETVINIAASLEEESRHPIADALRREATQSVAVTDQQVSVGDGVAGRVAGSSYKLGKPGWLGADVPEALSADDKVVVGLTADGELVAWFIFADRLAEGIDKMFGELHTAGYETGIYTGAERLDTRFSSMAKAETGMSPQDKLERIKYRQSSDEKVLMIGDGVNDTSALSAAHLSIAVNPVDSIVQGAADAMTTGNMLPSLPRVISYAARVRRIISQNLLWAFAYNMTLIPLAVMGFVPPWLAALGMSLSSLLVVGNACRLVRW